MLLNRAIFIDEYNSHYRGSVLEFHEHLVKSHEGYASASYHSTYSRIAGLRKRGLLPLEAGVTVEPTTVLTGISRYHKLEDGGIWVKSNTSKQQQLDAYKQAIAEVIEEVPAVRPIPVDPVSIFDGELMTFYPLPDLHLGLLIHGDEVHHGQNWDVSIATKWITDAMDGLVASAPSTRTAVITDLGDVLHSADDTKQTKSGHHLDVDGRHSKIVKASFDLIRHLIDIALTKHELVYFYSVPGNHSELVSIYLKAFLTAWYKDEPRVIIHEPNQAQQYHIFGRNILGFAHGHELKPANAGEVLAYDNQSIFSDSTHRVFHFGHYHHNYSEEGRICNIEIHQNITPEDAWASSMGYRTTIGQAKSIVYHKDYGEVARATFNINMTKE